MPWITVTRITTCQRCGTQVRALCSNLGWCAACDLAVQHKQSRRALTAEQARLDRLYAQAGATIVEDFLRLAMHKEEW
jgi:hypothetical protein